MSIKNDFAVFTQYKITSKKDKLARSFKNIYLFEISINMMKSSENLNNFSCFEN